MRRSRKWLDEYNQTIGGSRAAAVLGKSPWESARDIYDQMFGGEQKKNIDDSPDIRRGQLLEPIAISELNRSAKLKMKRWPQSKFIYNYNMLFAHCLPDAVDDIACPREIAEVKVPRPATWQRMYLSGIPEHYQIQAQHNMAVTRADVVHFAALCPVSMNLLYVPIQRNPEVIEQIMAGEREFFERGRRGIRPEAGDTTSTLELPPIEGELIVLDSEEAVRAAQAYREAKSLLDESQEIVEQAKEQLLAVAGDAAAFEIPGVLRGYNRMQPGRETFDAKKALAEHPELSSYMKTGKPFKTFRAYSLTQKG